MRNVLQPYEVWLPPEILEAGYNRVFDIPVRDCTHLSESIRALSQWYCDVVEKPERAWEERICVPSSSECLKSLSEALSAFVPVSLVICGSTCFCRCAPLEHPTSKVAWFLFRERVDGGDGNWSISLFDNEFGREWMFLSSLLSGFREDYPPSGGEWIGLSAGDPLMTDDYVRGNFGRFELTPRWSPSSKVFGARNGDAILVNRSGEWGWWKEGSEDAIVFSGDLSSLIQLFVRFFQSLAESGCDEDATSRQIILDSQFGQWRPVRTTR